MSGAISGVPAPARHELRRERLLELLHRHAARPLILLVAPAGFGKTTLAAAYARGSGAVVAWLSLAAGDRDSRAFFGRVRAALEAAFADPTLLPGLRRGLDEGAQGVALARLLAADLARAPAGFILVLDDFPAPPGVEELCAALDTLLRSLPEIGQVVITARQTPPLAITRLVANDAVFALGAEDLRFTPGEAEALQRLLGREATPDDRAEGWVAGILLGGAPRQLGAAGGSLLGGYVEREVLGRLRPAERRWLEVLAVLETITPAAAERLLGPGPWAARLAALAERCPFLVAREGGSYRLHGLVREALLVRLRRAGAARAARAWQVARALAEEAYDIAAVVRACQELGQIERAVELVHRSAEEAMQAGRWAATLATLDLLPEPVRRANAGLSLLEAYALMLSGRPGPAHDAAEAALQQSARSGDAALQIGALLELAHVARWTGDLDAAESWLAAADHLLATSSLPVERLRLLEGRALALRGLCLAVRGRADQARAELESAERLLALIGPSRDLAHVLTNLGTLCSRTGHYARAQSSLSAATSVWRLIGDRSALAMTQLALGNLCLRMGQLDAAGSALTGALEAARLVGAQRLEAYALASIGEWHRASGRIADAAAAFDESRELAEEVGEREPLVEALRLRAEVAVVQGELRPARELLARAQAEAQRLGSDFQLAGVERALGRLHLAEGAGERAAAHLEAALQRGASAWGPAERLAALYWLGCAYLALGRAAEAEAALREAVALAGPVGGASALAGPAAEDPRLLRYGLQLNLDPAVLGEAERLAIARRPWTGLREGAALEVVVRNDFPRVEARLLGSLVVHRDGELVDTGVRRVGRAGELLALLVLRERGLPAREIAGLLWPEMAPERAQHNLRMTAYQLRQLLGCKGAVRHVAGAYQLAPQLELWADVRAFDAALARARVASGEASVAALESALALYRGPLLEDVTRDWVQGFRLTYQARFIRAALRLADLLAPHDLARSDALAERVLAFEPENEAAYERLISNAQARRDAIGVRRAVRRYRLAAVRHGFAPNPRLVRSGQ